MFMPQTRPDCASTVLGCMGAAQAYRDGALMVGYGATISTPSLVAVMSQQLNVQPVRMRIHRQKETQRQEDFVVGWVLMRVWVCLFSAG